MRAVIFDIDHTIFNANQALHDSVVDLLKILKNLGIRVGAISGNDHRALVRLDEAGIRHLFMDVMCSDYDESPKSTAALHRLLQKLEVELDETALVSHAHADILLGKDAGVARTIGISFGSKNIKPLREAGADHIVSNIPSILDVLHG
jgi:phosphoglycolate phosphatase-like HAD superfamily hydrolase